MTKNITKNDKIRILVNDNKRMSEDNKRLHALSNEELSGHMITEMGRYSDIIDKLYEKYKELDELKRIGIMLKWKYRLILMRLKVRETLNL